MDEIKKLEEIGLKEVSNRTHIEVKHLEYIVNSEFDKLNRSSTVGFIQILSREYNLDLSDWLEDAEQYWSEHKIDANRLQIFTAQESKIFPKIIFIFISLLILVAILYGAYVFLNKKLNFFENPLVKNDTNYTYDTTPVVDEAKQHIDANITKNDKNTTVMISENNGSKNTKPLIKESIEDMNISVLPPEPKETKEVNKPSKEANISVANSDIPNTPPAVKSNDYITPKSKLWVGIIYLENYKRKSYLGKDDIMIDAKKDQIITTGHGNFVLHINGVDKTFPPQNPVRLYIKDGKVSVISNEKFKQLNRGSLW